MVAQRYVAHSAWGHGCSPSFSKTGGRRCPVTTGKRPLGSQICVGPCFCPAALVPSFAAGSTNRPALRCEDGRSLWRPSDDWALT